MACICQNNYRQGEIRSKILDLICVYYEMNPHPEDSYRVCGV